MSNDNNQNNPNPNEAQGTAATATAEYLSDKYKTNAHLLITNSPKVDADTVKEAWDKNTSIKLDLKKQYITGMDIIPTLDGNKKFVTSSIDVIVKTPAKRGPNDRALCLDCLIVGNNSSIPGGHLVGCMPLDENGNAIRDEENKLVRRGIDLPLMEGTVVQIVIFTDLEYGVVKYIQTTELGVEFRHDPTYDAAMKNLGYFLPNPDLEGLSEDNMVFSDEDENE